MSPYAVGMARERHVPPPSALEVELLDDELAVFTWPAAAAAAAAGAEPLSRLSAAERAVLSLIVKGASNAAVAMTRGTSVRTVANQVASLLRKLDAASRFELIKRYAHVDHG